VVNSSYKRSSVDVINNAVAIATYHVNDEYTVHTKSNVYIAAFVTASNTGDANRDQTVTTLTASIFL
jgi:hypothetical protein